MSSQTAPWHSAPMCRESDFDRPNTESDDVIAVDGPSTDRGPGPEGAAEVLERIRAGEVGTVIVGGCDTNGIFRAKRLSAGRFAGMLPEPIVPVGPEVLSMDYADFPQARPPDFEGWWPDWT